MEMNASERQQQARERAAEKAAGKTTGKVTGSAKQTTRVVRRKPSYRPLQYTLVIGSFVASLMGAVWLQGHDSYAASSATQSASQTGTTVSQVASAPVTEPALSWSDDSEASVDQGSTAFDESASSVQQSAPVQTYSFPRAVARSRSSR
jgi:hypothetical protein